jgi:hypothetical protein
MRRLVLTCLFAGLILPSTALALKAAPGDGRLVVRNVSGEPGQVVVSLTINGAAIGQIDRGRITVLPGAGPEPDVMGASRQIDRADGSTTYIGTGLRFRAVADTFRVRIAGSGIDINVVGQGTVRFFGSAANPSAGKYSVNSGPWLPATDTGAPISIGASVTLGP